MLKRALPATALILAALPALAEKHAPDEPLAAPGEFVWIAGSECNVEGRQIQVHVKERLDAPGRTAAWLLEACVRGNELPTACLATMTATQPLPEGMDESGRSFLVRCVPQAKLAWVVDLQWTPAGLDLQAWRLDLKPLVDAPIVDGEGGLKEIALKPGAQLVPDEPHGWKAGDPRPGPACEPLAVDATPAGEDLDIVIRARTEECTSWKVRYEGQRGTFTASPLPGSAPPDLLRDMPKGPLELKPGAATRPAPATPAEDATPERRKRAPGAGWSSFSRR